MRSNFTVTAQELSQGIETPQLILNLTVKPKRPVKHTIRRSPIEAWSMFNFSWPTAQLKSCPVGFS